MEMRILILLLPLLLAAPAPAASDDWRAAARAMYADVIAMPTVSEKAGARSMADYLADVFRKAGFAGENIKVLPYGKTAALMARLPAAGKATARPILLIAHMDVVDALESDWTKPPCKLIADDGYFYGRGTNDNKGGAVALVITLLRLHKEGFKPNRDLVLFFTGDEETDGVGRRKWPGSGAACTMRNSRLIQTISAENFSPTARPLGLGSRPPRKSMPHFL